MIVLVNCFIVTYLIYAWCFDQPKNATSRKLALFIDPIARWMGLWHSWRMFAPNPIFVNRKVAVELTHPDGSVKIFDEPDISTMGKWSAFLNSRERKYQSSLTGNSYKSHRPAICKYVLNQAIEAGEPVSIVRLVVFKQLIPAPGVYEENEIKRVVLWKMTNQNEVNN